MGKSVAPSRVSAARIRPSRPANFAACPASDAHREARMAGDVVDHEVAVGRHVVEAAARAQLRAAVAGKDPLDELREAPDTLGVRVPGALLQVHRRAAEVLRRLRGHLAEDGEAVVLLVAVAVPDPNREAVGREVPQVGRGEVTGVSIAVT